MEEVTGLSADEKRWRAESDARSLAEADAIQKDPKRLEAATEAAKRMAEEQQRDADAMTRVAAGIFSYPKMQDKKGE